MPRLTDLARRGRDLRQCPRCRERFVAPRAIVASYDDGRHVVDLACANCGWHAVECHATARLEALDDALEHYTAQIEASAEVLARALEIDRMERFVRALHAGHILPEDF
jgi:hypothetical protein